MKLQTWIPFYSATQAQNYLLSLVCLLLIRGAFLLFALAKSGIGVGPDEAQYWLWSQNPDLAYYSKPPGIAWEIWLGTALFGNIGLGIRIGALVLGSFLSLAVYLLAMACGLKPSTAFWAGVVMAVAPLGILGSFLATTDVGYVLFWTLACALVALALRRGIPPNYLLVGMFIGLGALFKWPIYIFWVLLLPFTWVAPRLRSWRILGGFGVSLLGLVPSLIWNVQHDWVTFRHVWATVQGDPRISAVWGKGNFLEFLGAQVALLSPVFFCLLIASIVIFVKKRRRLGLPVFFCGYVSLVILGAFFIFSLFQKMQGNWAVCAYPTASVLIAWYACEWLRLGKSYLLGGAVISVTLTAFVLAIPSLQSNAVGPLFPISYRLNPFRANVGWESLEAYLKEDGYEPNEHFLASDRYQTSALLSLYSEGKRRAYVLNLNESRKNQFSIWPSLADERLGQNGFFVFIDGQSRTVEHRGALVTQLQEQLSDYFRTIEYLGPRPLFSCYGKDVKNALVFRCDEYNGSVPAEVDIY